MEGQSKSFFPVESSLSHPPARHRLQYSTTPESRFWRSFSNSELASSLVYPVTSVDFSPSAPFDLAAAVGPSVRLFHGGDLSPRSHLSSFSDVAHSPSFRCDGALLAAGGDSGEVQIFRPSKSGPALRRLRAHQRPVRLVRYPRALDKLHLFSGGDDALFCYWDVSSGSRILSFPGAHKDYIRAGCPSPVSSELFATGSYDHTVKIWDVRVPAEANPVSSFNHGDPVESVQFLPSGTLLATAGGNCVKIWDVVGGGRLIHTMESHNKTVTSLCLGTKIGTDDGGGGGGGGVESRLLSVSLDGYLKSFDFAKFKITHSMRYPAQLLSVGFSPSSLVRVVGTSNGVIYLGKKKKKKLETEEESKAVSVFDGFAPEPRKPILRPTSYRYFRRGQSEKPLESDFVIKKVSVKKLAEHDRLLKKFRHREALVSALNKRNPNSIVAVMEELVARKKLLKCLANLDVDELGLLLGFLQKYATMPRHARFLMELTRTVLEVRAEDVHSHEGLRTHVMNLKRMVAEEIQIQQSLQEIQGMISPLLVIAGR